MKAGLDKRGKIVRVGRISAEHRLADKSLIETAEESWESMASEAPAVESVVQRRKSSFEVAASRRGSRTLQARQTIQNVSTGGGQRASISGGGVFEKTVDPRALARIEFEEAKRLAKEFHMDFNEVKQVIDIFYSADVDESSGLDKKELERALARVHDVFVVPQKDVDTAWKFMIGKRPMSFERVLDEVTIEAFFHWYVEHLGNRCVSRSVRQRPSLITQMTSSASATSVGAVKSKLPAALRKLLPDISLKTSPSTPSTRASESPSKSDIESPEPFPKISVHAAGPSPAWSSTLRPPGIATSALDEVSLLSPRSPTSMISEPLSPLSPLTPPVSAGAAGVLSCDPPQMASKNLRRTASR
jgi:hypothetical protein